MASLMYEAKIDYVNSNLIRCFSKTTKHHFSSIIFEPVAQTKKNQQQTVSLNKQTQANKHMSSQAKSFISVGLFYTFSHRHPLFSSKIINITIVLIRFDLIYETLHTGSFPLIIIFQTIFYLFIQVNQVAQHLNAT